jgi:peptidoglycan hydrolase-like protein with peptidoglycan-binding domain
VFNRLRGTLTWLPSLGQLIRAGQRLYEVNGRPVILLDGPTPAYRDLTAGDGNGPDILELNRNLVDLGLDPDRIVIDDIWQPATTAGVKAFQVSLGESETGSLSLGEVVFLAGDQIVAAVEESLGDPLSVSTGGSATATAILQTTSTRLTVTVDLPASSQSEARVGAKVTLEMPAGDVVHGVITAVRPVAASSSSSSSTPAGASPSTAATIPVTIKLEGHTSGAGLDQAAVSVGFAQAVASNVLSVPVSALLATSGGAYAVQEAQPRTG